MVEQVIGELILEAHYRQYLLRKLDPRTAHLTPNGHELCERISEILKLRVRVTQDAANTLHGKRGRLPLTIAGDDLPRINPYAHEEVMKLVRSTYHTEFCRFVDVEHYGKGIAKGEAITSFRDLYGITEEDYRFETSVRMYRKYERRKNRDLGGRGRPKNPGGRRVMRALMNAKPAG